MYFVNFIWKHGVMGKISERFTIDLRISTSAVARTNYLFKKLVPGNDRISDASDGDTILGVGEELGVESA